MTRKVGWQQTVRGRRRRRTVLTGTGWTEKKIRRNYTGLRDVMECMNNRRRRRFGMGRKPGRIVCTLVRCALLDGNIKIHWWECCFTDRRSQVPKENEVRGPRNNTNGFLKCDLIFFPPRQEMSQVPYLSQGQGRWVLFGFREKIIQLWTSWFHTHTHLYCSSILFIYYARVLRYAVATLRRHFVSSDPVPVASNHWVESVPF